MLCPGCHDSMADPVIGMAVLLFGSSVERANRMAALLRAQIQRYPVVLVEVIGYRIAFSKKPALTNDLGRFEWFTRNQG